MSLSKNIEDRQWFETMVEERGDRFWELCSERLFPKVVDEIDESLMTQGEVKAFERTTMKFGVHKGKAIGEVPGHYLEFIADTREWIKELNKYLKTKGLQ